MTNLKNLNALFDQFDALYTPQVITEVNDTQVMLVKVLGDKVPWHTHDNEDELFLVYEGCIKVHLKGEVISVNRGELFKVPKGTEHKITSAELSLVLLLESKHFEHTGKVASEITLNAFSTLS